jgi:hypothetical protein
LHDHQFGFIFWFQVVVLESHAGRKNEVNSVLWIDFEVHHHPADYQIAFACVFDMLENYYTGLSVYTY